jgi:DNA-binding beta-propeller fold protein YncE
LFVVCYLDGKQGNGTMNIIETQANTVICESEYRFQSPFLTLTPDGKKLLVCKFAQNTVAEIQLENTQSILGGMCCPY